jgi:acetyl-CoA C-acetyltransferase
MFEQALRIDAGEPSDVHRTRIAELWAQFSAVAERNPHAWSRTALSADQIRQPSAEQQDDHLALHQTDELNNMVDQGAVIILASAEKGGSSADATDLWVFPYAGTDAHDTYAIGERDELHRSPAIRLAGRTCSSWPISASMTST